MSTIFGCLDSADSMKTINCRLLNHRLLLVDANDADYRFSPRNGPISKGSISETS